MRNRIFAIVLCMVALLVVPGWGQAMNFHEPADLDKIIIDQDRRLLVPVIESPSQYGLLVATEFHNAPLGLSLQMPMIEVDGEKIFVLTENQEGRLYIQLLGSEETYSSPTSTVLGIKTTISDYSGIRTIDNTPEKQANGRMVFIPLINYPEGTNGYVMILLPNPDGPGLIIPLLEMPRGHLMAQQHTDNPHVDNNPWEIEYDLLMAVDYSILRFR